MHWCGKRLCPVSPCAGCRERGRLLHLPDLLPGLVGLPVRPDGPQPGLPDGRLDGVPGIAGIEPCPVIRELSKHGLLHDGALTVNGRSIGDNNRSARCWKPDVVRTFETEVVKRVPARKPVRATADSDSPDGRDTTILSADRSAVTSSARTV